MIGSIILISIAFYFIIYNNIKGLLAIIIVSLTNDLFAINIGFSLPIHYLISILYFPKLVINYGLISRRVIRIISPLVKEFGYLIILAIILGLIFPWRSPFDYQRTWSQMAEGKVLTQIFRLIAEFSLLFLILFWLYTKKITITYILKITAIIISCSVIFSIIDVSFNLGVKYFLFLGARDLGFRFTALNGEPRVLGHISSLILLLLVSFYKTDKNTAIKFGIFFSTMGVLISLSASTYILTLVWGMIFILFIGKIRYLFYVTPIFILALFYLGQNDFFTQETVKKIEIVMNTDKSKSNSEKVSAHEPAIFRRFEVFDRAALNFLYENPIYFLTGTGPNLISIPSSPYLTNSARVMYGDKIDSAPHTFFINLISRSGFIGITFWFIFIFRFKSILKNIDEKIYILFLCLMISHFILFSSFFFLIVGVLLFIVQNEETFDKTQI